MNKLQTEIQQAINRASAENGSNTPDFILAEYLTDCLAAYDRAFVAREKWYGRADLNGIELPARRGRDQLEAMECAGAEQARRADENRDWALKAERERDEARSQLTAKKRL